MPDVPEPRKPVLVRIKDLAPLGILIAVFMMGFGLSSFQVNHDLRRKDEQIAQKERELRARDEENRRTLAELQQARLSLALREPGSTRISEPPSPGGQRSVTPNTKPAAGPPTNIQPNGHSEDMSLQVGKSASAFNGDIVISLVAVPFGGDPLRHRIVANVGSPGRPTVNLNTVEVGHAVTFQTAQFPYEIRVTGADTLSGQFLVTRLQPK